MILKRYICASGEVLLYNGNPNFKKLESLANGVGDIWHSSFDQGYKNAFPELVYQAAVFFWYLNDFDNLNQCLSWRINPNHFAIREKVWNELDGFDKDYKNVQMQALDFGFNAVQKFGAVPIYSKGLFEIYQEEKVKISPTDRYLFFKKNFRTEHSLYMLFRRGFFNINEWISFFYVNKNYKKRNRNYYVAPRSLNNIEGKPTVSYIIPTMLRQDFTLNLLDDLSNQSYLPSQVVVVDATPEEIRDETLYNNKEYPFELVVKWQTSKGSCRARNEAISICEGEFIIFGDDDIRIPKNFIENHLKLLQTYNAGACNGLDIRADNDKQNLHHLEEKISKIDKSDLVVGVAKSFSNANSCVKKEYVDKLIGNDVNFDGGYGEDSDFGLSLTKIGVVVLQNPFSANLHLKPSSGGYRFWGSQAKIIGKKRKTQPWELDSPVKRITPVPSPTIMYGILKHYSLKQLQEYKWKYLALYLFKGSKMGFILRFFNLPIKLLKFKKSLFYAEKLMKLGIRYK